MVFPGASPADEVAKQIAQTKEMMAFWCDLSLRWATAQFRGFARALDYELNKAGPSDEISAWVCWIADLHCNDVAKCRNLSEATKLIRKHLPQRIQKEICGDEDKVHRFGVRVKKHLALCGLKLASRGQPKYSDSR